MSKISMKKIIEIFRQRFELKLTYREIANSLGIGIATGSNYLCRAKVIGISWCCINKPCSTKFYASSFVNHASSTCRARVNHE